MIDSRRLGRWGAVLGPRIPMSYRDPLSLGQMHALGAEKYGRVPVILQRPLSVDPQSRLELDYVELSNLVDELSGALLKAGVGPWDRLAIVKSSNYDTTLIAAAAARIGAIPALISPNLAPLGEALAVLLTRLGMPFVFTDQATVDAAGLPAERWRRLSRGLIGPVEDGMRLEDLYGGPVPPAQPRTGEEPMFITHTGGTTGVPKMAEQTVAGACHVVNIEARRTPWAQSAGDTLAAAITWVHGRSIYGTMATLSRGTKLIALSGPDVETVLSMCREHKPTIVESHPNHFMQWEGLCDHPDEPFGNVRVFFNTFDAAHPRTIRKLLGASRRRAPIYLQAYGMTEVGPVTMRAYGRRAVERPANDGASTKSRDLGWPVPFATRFRIVDPKTHHPLPRGDIGMIQAKTKARCTGFVDQAQKYWDRRHGGWFDTGDYGRATRMGTLEMLDREVDHIDGVDSCLAIEDILIDRIASIGEVVVVPDDEGTPVPMVSTHDDEPLDLVAWKAATRDIPSIGPPLHLLEADLPRTETFKARRFLLRERIKTERSNGDAAEIALRDGA